MRYVSEYRDYSATPISAVSMKAYEDVRYQTYHVNLVQWNLGGEGGLTRVGDKKVRHCPDGERAVKTSRGDGALVELRRVVGDPDPRGAAPPDVFQHYDFVVQSGDLHH